MTTKPRYMLDFDICIAVQRGTSKAVTDRLLALEPGEALLPLVVYGELRVGVEKSRHRERAMAALDTLLGGFPVADLSAEVADVYGTIRAELERRGETIGSNDLWIAAHAKAAGLTLVTGNEREFLRAAGLSVENWAIQGAR